MAVFHVSVDRIVKGTHAGGAAGFAIYIAREQQEHAAQHARYLAREGQTEKDDLIAAGHANLPTWAQDATDFFAMADRYEDTGRILARTYEIALPRELSPAGRVALVEDIRATFFTRHPHAWALHNPVARDGEEQPHVHLMVNERLLDDVPREPERFFRRAAVTGRDPASGGARKELYWNTKVSLVERRAGIAVLINAALEREGQAVAVSPQTLRAQGHTRSPERELAQKERWKLHHGREVAGWDETLARREVLHRDYYPWENDLNRAAWHQLKERYNIRDIGRETIVDQVRDRFWGHDHSPARMREREESFLRDLDRAYARPRQSVARGLEGLEHLLHEEETLQRGVEFRAREHDDDAERTWGMSQ